MPSAARQADSVSPPLAAGPGEARPSSLDSERRDGTPDVMAAWAWGTDSDVSSPLFSLSLLSFAPSRPPRTPPAQSPARPLLGPQAALSLSLSLFLSLSLPPSLSSTVSGPMPPPPGHSPPAGAERPSHATLPLPQGRTRTGPRRRARRAQLRAGEFSRPCHGRDCSARGCRPCRQGQRPIRADFPPARSLSFSLSLSPRSLSCAAFDPR